MRGARCLAAPPAVIECVHIRAAASTGVEDEVAVLGGAMALADQIRVGRYVRSADRRQRGNQRIRDARGVQFAESSWYPVFGLVRKAKFAEIRKFERKKPGVRIGARHVRWESCQLAAHTRVGRSVGREDRPPQWGVVHEHTPVRIPVFMNTETENANSNFHLATVPPQKQKQNPPMPCP